jgi:hypothetical protein
MLETRLGRILWRIADGLDHWLTLARLRTLDALAGPLPETPEDQQRERDREQLEGAFPGIDCKGPGAAISHGADRNRRDSRSRGIGRGAVSRQSSFLLDKARLSLTNGEQGCFCLVRVVTAIPAAPRSS